MNRRSLIVSSSAAVAAHVFSADAPPRIRIGQIGTAHAHAAGKMGDMRKLADLYDVVGIAEDVAVLRMPAQKGAAYEDLRWMSEDELLATPDLRAVAIETRIEDAPAAVRKCIRAGKHMHLDKPGALEHAEFRAFSAEAEERKLVIQMGYMLRYNPAFKLLFRAAREGWLGEIHQIDASMGKLADPGTRAKLAALPGGGMFELACHIIDAAVTLLGKPKAVHAISTPSLADGTWDNQLAVFEYERATATIRCDHTDPNGGAHRRFFVSGTKGAMEIVPLESGKATLRLSEARGEYKKGEQRITLPLPDGRYVSEFIDLAKVIRGEKTLAWNAAHDIAVHETLLRASGLPVA